MNRLDATGGKRCLFFRFVAQQKDAMFRALVPIGSDGPCKQVHRLGFPLAPGEIHEEERRSVRQLPADIARRPEIRVGRVA